MFQISNTFFSKKHSAVFSVLWLGLLWLSSTKAGEIASPAFLSLNKQSKTLAIQQPINQQFEQLGLDMLLSERGFFEGGEPSAVINELDELLTIQLNWVEQYPQCRDVVLKNLARLDISGLHDISSDIQITLYDRLVHHWHQLLEPVQFKASQSHVTQWNELKTGFQRLNSSRTHTQAELVDLSIQARPETASDSFVCE